MHIPAVPPPMQVAPAAMHMLPTQQPPPLQVLIAQQAWPGAPQVGAFEPPAPVILPPAPVLVPPVPRAEPPLPGLPGASGAEPSASVVVPPVPAVVPPSPRPPPPLVLAPPLPLGGWSGGVKVLQPVLLTESASSTAATRAQGVTVAI
jgi:hypothetical protein